MIRRSSRLRGYLVYFVVLEGFKHGISLVDSPMHGLDFCVGSWSEMGPGVIDAVRYFGERDRIFYVHFRDVQGYVPKFAESFVNDGNCDMFERNAGIKGKRIQRMDDYGSCSKYDKRYAAGTSCTRLYDRLYGSMS